MNSFNMFKEKYYSSLVVESKLDVGNDGEITFLPLANKAAQVLNGNAAAKVIDPTHQQNIALAEGNDKVDSPPLNSMPIDGGTIFVDSGNAKVSPDPPSSIQVTDENNVPLGDTNDRVASDGEVQM